MAYEPIAYTYEADFHCGACAETRFGRDRNRDIVGADREGNAVGVVAPWDEWWEPSFECAQVLGCGICGAEVVSINVVSESGVDLTVMTA